MKAEEAEVQVLNDQIEQKEVEIADIRRNIKKLEEYRVQYDH